MKFPGSVALILVVFVRGVSSGGAILSFESFERIVARAGDSLIISAVVELSNFTTYQLIEAGHKDFLTFQERSLGSLWDYSDVLSSVEGYTVSVTEVSAGRRDIHLLIETLSIVDDGRILFHLRSTLGFINATVEKFLTVILTPESVKIQFGNYDVVDSDSTLSIESNPGNVTVYCIVEFSNPAITNISLTLNGDDVTLETGPVAELVTSGERKYSSNVSAILELPSDLTDDQTLVCIAVDYYGQSHSVQLVYSFNGAGMIGRRALLDFLIIMVISVVLDTH